MPQPDLPLSRARELFPATRDCGYFNTAAVAPGSTVLESALAGAIAGWMSDGFDFAAAEQAGETARASFAALVGASVEDIALIPSVSAAAGFVAGQFGPARSGESVVIGARDYSSNHFPWRMLERKGYEVRQVPFVNGGMEPAEVAALTDDGTRLIAFSAVQAATGHRSDVPALSAIARDVGAMVFCDGSQIAGALPVAPILPEVDFLAASDHKFLLNAMRGVGYCYIRRDLQRRLTPLNAGWKAGQVPFDSFFGPDMRLSETASRFDQSLAWLTAIGDAAAMSLFCRFGADAIFSRNWSLAEDLRDVLQAAGWLPVPLPAENRSTIVSVPLGDAAPGDLLSHLRRHRIVAAVRDGQLRLSVHFYNNGDDLERLAGALAGFPR